VYYVLLIYLVILQRCVQNRVTGVVKGKADPSEMRTLRDLVNHLSVCVVSKKSKNVEMLHIAAEVTSILCQNFTAESIKKSPNYLLHFNES